VVCDGELPRVGEKDGDDFSGLETGGDETMGKGFDEGCIFAIGDTAVRGGVDEGSLGGMALATVENDIVEKKAVWVGEKRCALHSSRL
jgi:hypothetical protein